MRIAVLLGIAAIVAYSSNLLLHIEGDASPNVLSAASWVIQGNADLDEYVGRAPFQAQIIDGHVYPPNPPGTALLAVVPVSLAIAAGADPASYEFLAVFGKIAGVLAAGLSVVFVYVACVAIARPVPAVVATAAYAFGTTVWSVSAQQIWMHGPAQLFAAAGFVMAWRARRDERVLVVRDASVAALGIYVVYSLFGAWWAGWAYGTRYLSDAQPLYALAVAFALDRGVLARLWTRIAF